MKDKVSIIVPCYNAENTLSRCLDSLLAQSYPYLQILVVNDGSTDGTAGICDAYGTRNNCIEVIHQQNKGVSAARNAGMDRAEGEFIVFVDSDDYVGSDHISTLMEWKDHDFVTAGFHGVIQDTGDGYTQTFVDESVDIETVKAYPSQYLGKSYFGTPWAKLFRTRIIHENQLRFDTSIHNGEDNIFVFEYLGCVSKIRIVEQCNYYYILSANSLSHSAKKEHVGWRLMVEEKMASFFDPQSADDIVWQEERFFAVIKQLMKQYSTYLSIEEQSQLFCHPLFARGIEKKRQDGTFDDKLFIWCMAHGKYVLYKNWQQLRNAACMILNMPRRIVGKVWRVIRNL